MHKRNTRSHGNQHRPTTKRTARRSKAPIPTAIPIKPQTQRISQQSTSQVESKAENQHDRRGHNRQSQEQFQSRSQQQRQAPATTEPEIRYVKQASCLSLCIVFLLGCIVGGITLHLRPNVIYNVLEGINAIRANETDQPVADNPDEEPPTLATPDNASTKTKAETSNGTTTTAARTNTSPANGVSLNAKANDASPNKPRLNSDHGQTGSAAQISTLHGKNSDLHSYTAEKHETFKQGSFEIKTTMPSLPVVTCDYRIPLNTAGQALASAHDLVLLFPFPTEKAAIKGIGKALSDHWGFTTISIRFPGMGPGEGVDCYDPSQWYYYPESGAGPAWLKAIDQVRKLGGLSTRSVFVSGRSGGGSAAGLFADAYPHTVAAVANEAGRDFADQPQFTGPLLIMYGAHDYVVKPIEHFAADARLRQRPVSLFTFPATWDRRGIWDTWQHTITENAAVAMWQWLADIANRRRADGSIPALQDWAITNNGTTYTSQAFKSAVEKLIPVSETAHSAEASVITASPAPSAAIKGTVVFAGTDFTLDETETVLDAECYADHGWRCIAIIGTSKTSLPSIVSDMYKKASTGNDKNSPVFLITDEPDTLSMLLKETQIPWSGIITLRPRFSALKKVVALSEQQSLMLGVVAIKSMISVLKRKFAEIKAEQLAEQPAQQQILHINSWGSFKAKNLGQWHRGALDESLKQLQKWSKKNNS